ncbi:MAG: cell filamentation protein Fic [Proteobacteria bacterium]|nr:cell filamentation protein Fic [Pseudomonadota bacterium]
MNPHYPKGATPLSPDELAGLIPKVITTHGELNRLEQKNILEALTWAHRQKGNLLSNTGYRIHYEVLGQPDPAAAARLDEIAIEFHHKLVQIHVFPNGNGRHARLLTDLILERNGRPPFSWGANTSQEEIHVESHIRDTYIHALKLADQKNYGELLNFARS